MFNFSSHLLSRLFVFTLASLLSTILLLALSSGQTQALAQVPTKISNGDNPVKVKSLEKETKDFSLPFSLFGDKKSPQFSLEPDALAAFKTVAVDKKKTFVVSNETPISFTLKDNLAIKWRDVQVNVVGKVQFDEKSSPVEPERSMASVECPGHGIRQGECKLTLQPGLYKLTDIVIKAQDVAGNESSTTLAKLFSNKAVNILVDDVSLDISVTTKEKAVVNETTYVRTQPALKFTFKNDKWFSHRSSWFNNDSKVVTITNKDGKIDFSFKELKFQKEKNQAHTYTSTYAIPSLNDKTAKKTAEGKYEILFSGGVPGEQATLSLEFDQSKPVLKSHKVTLKGRAHTLTSEDGGSQEDLMISSGELALEFSDLNDVYTIVAYKADPVSHDKTVGAETTVNWWTKTARLELKEDGLRIDSFGFIDCAGNVTVLPVSSLVSEGFTNQFKNVKEIVIDGEKPVVDTRVYREARPYQDLMGDNYSGTDPLIMEVKIKESNFDLLVKSKKDAIASFIVDGELKQKLTAADFTPMYGVWVARVKLDSGDAEYKLVVPELTDISGRKSGASERQITIDNVAPQLSISFDNDSSSQGQYYNAPRTATIRLVEKNPNQDKALVAITAKNSAGKPISSPSLSDWRRVSGTGDTYEATVPFLADGHYAVTAYATDEVGHKSSNIDVAEFVIDTTEPELICTGNLENGRAYGNDVSQTCKITDAHLDPLLSSYKLEGARNGQAVTSRIVSEKSSDEKEKSFSFTFPKELAYDDVYKLTLDAVDMAGNSHVEKWNFSINRFGSTFSFSDEAEKMRGTYVKKASDIEIYETNVSGVPLNSLNINVGRNSDDSRKLQTRDYVARTLDERGWHRNVYSLPSSLFKQDGAYTIVVESTDLAGNLSRNTKNNSNMRRNDSASYEFIVDGTKPVAELTGIQSGSSYRQTSLTVDANISDANILYAELKIDGKKVTEWNEKQLQDGNPSYTIPADSEEHTIELVAVDKAMNKTTAKYTDVLVTKDYVSPVLEDSRKSGFVVAASIIVGMLISGIGIALYWRGYRRETKAAIFNA